MTYTQFSKSIILKDFDINKNVNDIPLTQGLGISHRQSENNETYQTIIGTKFQINKYCQDAGKHLLSERSRHFTNLPKWRIMGNIKVRVQ
jgi:hypothetical protein